jgi:hypothetical protein
MSKSCRAALNVMPLTLGGPQEHNGPPPRIGGGPSPVRSTTTFYFLVGFIPLLTFSLSLPPALVLVANPRVALCFPLKSVDACMLGIQLDYYTCYPLNFMHMKNYSLLVCRHKVLVF